MTEPSIAEKWAAKAFAHGHQMTLDQTIQAAIDEATAELRAERDLLVSKMGELRAERDKDLQCETVRTLLSALADELMRRSAFESITFTGVNKAIRAVLANKP